MSSSMEQQGEGSPQKNLQNILELELPDLLRIMEEKRQRREKLNLKTYKRYV